jgi:NADH oxidase (H2O2-forming)
MKKEIVIIGGSAAGITAGITARRHYQDAKITIVRKEDKVLIPCGIPYIFGTVGNPEKNLIPDAIMKKNNIELVMDEVESIDRTGKAVVTKSGKRIGYHKLVLATGSRPIVLPLPGIEKKNVFNVKKDIAYLQDLSDALEKASDLVVIGGGFIGVEFADECKKFNKDLNVTIVELLPHCLLLACDEEFCVQAEQRLTDRGVKILTEEKAEAILGDKKVEQVKLASGKDLKADVVILGVGVVPNTDLAAAAGLKIGEGKAIHVDQYMRTSDKDIFACGDCCEKFSSFNRGPSGLRLASIAAIEARIAGANLFYLKRKNEGAIGVFATMVNGLTVGTAGLTEVAAKKAGYDVVAEVATGPDRHPGVMPGCSDLHVKLLFEKRSGKLLGGQVRGGVSGGELLNAISAAISAGMRADDVATFQMGTHPALTASPIAYQLVNAAENAVGHISKPRILMVEDDRDFASAVKAVLASQPYTVDVAHNREEAMKKIESEKPDLLLLDIMLDEVDDGFTICRELKSDPEYWSIPILAISAISKEAGIDPGLGEHFKADDFLEKPVKAVDLLEKIKKYL